MKGTEAPNLEAAGSIRVQWRNLVIAELSFSPLSLQQGDSSAISGTVTDNDGKPVAGVTISFTAEGLPSPSSTTTDSSGRFSSQVAVPSNAKADSHAITATAEKKPGYIDATAERGLEVTERPPLPDTTNVGVAVAGAVVGTAVAVATSQRTEEPSVEGGLTEDEKKHIIQWGIEHNRSPEDIENDLNEADKTHGGNGDIKLSDLQDQQPVQVVTADGKTVTMTQKDAAEYNSAKAGLEFDKGALELVKNHLKDLEKQSKMWSGIEAGTTGLRWLAGLDQASTLYSDYQKKLSRIADIFPDPQDAQARLKAETDALVEYNHKIQELTGRAGDQPGDWGVAPPKPKSSFAPLSPGENLEQKFIGTNSTYSSQPVPEQNRTLPGSWMQRPAAKLDQIQQEQQFWIDRLKETGARIQNETNKMNSLVNHATE